jgi:hypothetical protein
LLFTFAITFFSSYFAQTFPFSITTILQPPSSPYLSDYFATGSDKLTANVTFNDFNEPSWNFRLRLTIESANIKIQTSPNYIPAQPITIYPGIPLVLTESVLASYFDFSHLTFQGISPQQLSNNGKLPDDLYSFCLEVLDYNSGVVLSNKSCQMSNIQSLDEPTIITPICGSVAVPNPIQNIMFQWQLSNGISASQQASLEYTLNVWEVTDPLINPMQALQNNKVLLVHHVEHITQTNYLYDATAPALELGKRYVYQVQIKDVNGKDLFKNNGKSEVCWFSFGYASGGTIPLNFPANNGAFGRTDPPLFKWQAPTNVVPGQQFNYVLKIVKINQGQTAEQAMISNPDWHDETTSPTTMPQWDLLLNVPFESMTDYAWQVVGYSGSQEIAKSAVWKFRGPGAIDQFNAGNHIVYVTSTTGNDLNHLTGTGTIKFGSDSSMLAVSFEDIKIVAVAGRYVLENGEIYQPLTNFNAIDLSPDITENGHAAFYAHHLKLNKQELSLQGIVKWPLPHAVTTGEAAAVKSDDTWLNYDNFKLLGNALLNDSNDFQLADPYHYQLKLLSGSDFLITQNKFFLRFNGKLFLPQNVKGLASERIFASFFNAKQLFYLNDQETKISQDLALFPNSKIDLIPKFLVIDLSDTESPGKLSGDKSWKGIYFEKFNLKYHQDIDNGKQLKLSAEITQEYNLNNSNNLKSWVNANGLTHEFAANFTSSDKGSFNKFTSNFNTVDLKIENSIVESGHFKGSILIPLLSTSERYAYTVPVTNDGFEEGYMDVSLNNKNVVFNENTPSKKLTMEIKQAVFADRERLDLTVDVKFHAIYANMTSLQNLKLWGNGDFGFEKKNGIVPLSNQVTGILENKFDLVVDSIGAARIGNVYGLVLRTTLIVSEDIAGAEGPPRMEFLSAEQIEGMPENISEEEAQEEEVQYEESSFLGSKNGINLKQGSDGSFVASVHIEVNTPACEFTGEMMFTKGDPDWGDCFQLYVKAAIKKPWEVTLSARFVVGEKDDFNYWFVSLKGEGLKLKIGPVQIYSLEGRVYSHMNHESQGVIMGEDDEFDYKPDPNISYGGFLMVGLTDAATEGATAQMELAVEMAFNTSGGLNNIGIQANVYIMKVGDVYAAKGTGIIYYNVPEEHWLVNVSVQAPSDGDVGPLCAKGTLEIDYQPNYWSIALGGEEQEDRIQITPGCMGWGGFGWLFINPDTINIGFGINWSARLDGPTIDIGIYDITPFCYAYAEFGVAADFVYRPSFVINTAKIWILLEAGIGIDYENVFDSGTWNFARVSLAGEANLRFNPKPVNLSGSLDGEIEVIGISCDFSLNANVDL